ncbi:hypothetical protein BKG83_09810 [Mycobacteroides chelonae]|jgi:hypothetical protein|uniref:Uncharacterized protein n=1 Tax=Mycobacteroides chelonae TaxID=1774 RepID=A0A1S1KRT7_MYCCH|nr:hypothetical protein BKG75_20435 [Mycobacteroides chelonae]OHU54686.1 hypothetical protein BKG83_09810 [Mycobacteroides chelonae]OHU75726.1 hypothetical protein BKG84_27275 [Mycobacteroides chelonae]SKM90453.1 Uncharacterised protein [Mycobacteroides abscessus subsp. bolletii]
MTVLRLEHLDVRVVAIEAHRSLGPLTADRAAADDRENEISENFKVAPGIPTFSSLMGLRRMLPRRSLTGSRRAQAIWSRGKRPVAALRHRQNDRGEHVARDQPSPDNQRTRHADNHSCETERDPARIRQDTATTRIAR